MDSPGHCAKYCTYTIMSQKTKQILAMEVVDKRECQLVSNRMEAVGFQRALSNIQESGILVQEVVTDAHPQIASIMSKHQYMYIVYMYIVYVLHSFRIVYVKTNIVPVSGTSSR